MLDTYRPQNDGIPIIDKATDAVLDYPMDWSEWLSDDEVIIGRLVTVQTGLTKQTDTATDSAVTVWLAGGTRGVDYLVTVEITTSQGRTDSRSFRVRLLLR